MNEKEIVSMICHIFNEIQMKQKVSGAICFRDIQLPKDKESKERIVELLEKQILEPQKLDTFDSIYQALGAYEDQLTKAKTLNHSSHTAMQVLSEETSAYYDILEVLMTVDQHRLAHQMEQLGSFHQEENIRKFYQLKNRKELFELALKELKDEKSREAAIYYDYKMSYILLENNIDMQEALCHYGFITQEEKREKQQKKGAVKTKLLNRYQKALEMAV